MSHGPRKSPNLAVFLRFAIGETGNHVPAVLPVKPQITDRNACDFVVRNAENVAVHPILAAGTSLISGEQDVIDVRVSARACMDLPERRRSPKQELGYLPITLMKHNPPLVAVIRHLEAPSGFGARRGGGATAQRQRDDEADAVAELCARLIGSHRILDRRFGEERLCQPGDIALLAPSGTDLWRYEEALERRGIPVATQAGKGLFRRQEIQDLIALTRVLADRRDTLALGALLRGPLVGLTEEELLDIIWALPRSKEEPDRLARLDLGVDPSAIGHPLARDVIEKLQTLRRHSNSTTPYDLLSQAIDMLEFRPILLERHRGQAERGLANVDLYLSLSRAYAVRGLRAFAEAMTAAWTDESRAVEGRPDAQEEAVALFTMHAAKGLEWPIVIPVNTMTSPKAPDSAVIDRQTETFYCPVLGVAPAGYENARQAEKQELDRERVRLWYVAATRARELLILPRLDATPSKSAWISLIDLALADLPSLDVSHLPSDVVVGDSGHGNQQTREIFAAEAAAIVGGQSHLTWLAPSRDESASGALLRVEETQLWAAEADDHTQGLPAVSDVQGGRERELVIHKLFEEVLTGETRDDVASLSARADELIRMLGLTPA